MESPTQLELLKQRIEYDQDIFNDLTYYEWEAINNSKIYTLSVKPEVGEITFTYEDGKMTESYPITSIIEDNKITVNHLTYEKNSNEVMTYEIYNKVLNRLLEDSKYVGLSLRYPYQDYSSMSLPSKYLNWQLRCAEEIYNGIGTVGIKSYSENGLSWTRDSGYISYELRNEIESLVGYVVSDEESE